MFVISSNLGAATSIKALLSIKSSQLSNIGLILINPNLYKKKPKVGQEENYLNAVSTIDLPIYLLQAELSPWKWQLTNLQSKMKQSGSDVFMHVKRNVRDRYYFRQDALDVEKEQAHNLEDDLINAMKQLSPYLTKLRQLSKNEQVAKRVFIDNDIERKPNLNAEDFVPYSGGQLPSFQLEGIDGKLHHLEDYKGKVVLLNFWASWCPPCVHEIPSMIQLKERFKEQSFEILAINLAEEKEQVGAFLRTKKVNFPVLLDEKSSLAKKWQVFTYPTSYLLNKSGKILYVIYGGYDWNNKEARNTVSELISQSNKKD